mmetsp:Transcript_18184/g.50599  ORF Transcript_18184/g.50599 Transcript_18184/m.50599 type:complete len:651 (+) Transcript_18184:64-2016(+)
MGCRKICLCCAAAPLSIVVLVAALVVPQLWPKPYCQVGSDGACKHVEEGPSDSCGAGVLLRVTKQAAIGLRHFPLAEGLAFATLELDGCIVEYSFACGSKGPQVSEQWTCKSEKKKSPEPSDLGKMWEVCAKGSSLKLKAPVIDLTFDIEVAAGSSVAGCIALSAPSAFPGLGAARGDFEAQRGALMEARAKEGRCATVRNDDDLLARGEDYLAEFNPVLAVTLKGFLSYMKYELLPELRKGLDTDRPEGSLKTTFFFVLTLASAGGLSGASMVMPMLNCGMMMPAMLPVPGVMQTRHADVGKLIADPHQRRPVMIGGGAAPCCFDETLPVFMSAGSPEHTQVRKLWDTIGLATMHLGDLSEITPLTDSTFIAVRKKAMALGGMTTPMLDELAGYVAPLFLEKLWGKKPTAEEAGEIAAYGSIGGPCIVSHVIRRLPILPGKIIAVREKAFTFAMGSPVGNLLATEIEKPEYAELREVYSKRPKGVVGTAVQNLADASLFAGLIGTSAASMNCLLQLNRGPQFVKMFRGNSTAFMYEVMRTATAVIGSMQQTKAPLKARIFGEDVLLPNGSLVEQVTGLGAGLDASVFPDPYRFDTSRQNLGETMNWNGKTKYVMARDYAGAPRFCPGGALSVKIAAKVCHHFSAHMKAE